LRTTIARVAARIAVRVEAHGLDVKLIPCDDLMPPGDVDTPDLLPPAR
jgi:hypothetical protein